MGRGVVPLTLILIFLASQLVWAQQVYYVRAVYVVSVDNTIGPYTVSQLSRAINAAEQSSGAVLVLLNTPGGLADSTLQAMQMIGSSSAPVIGFVYPDYGYAWSGGTYLLLSTHIATMAPHTVIGSCQPIQGTTPINESKILNALASYLATIMESYGRNSTYAYLCVERNLNLNAEEALRYHVINFVANNIGQLLDEINGTSILLNGRKVVVMVQSPALIRIEPTFGEMLQAWLMDPLVESILSLLALLIVIAAIASGHPLVAGLGVVLFLLSVIPYVSTGWIWAILFAMGVALLFAGMFSGGYTHGILEGTGAVLVILSFLSLFPPFQLQRQPVVVADYWPLVGSAMALSAILAGVVAFIAWKAVAVHLRRPVSEQLLTLRGLEGIAVDDIGPDRPGYVLVLGEYWKAISRVNIRKGCRVRVVEAEAPLVVEPVGNCGS
ncbi:MAG: NfeD family protein [Thermoproteus sp.]